MNGMFGDAYIHSAGNTIRYASIKDQGSRDDLTYLVRLRVEAPGIQREDAVLTPGKMCVLDERHVLGAGKGDADFVAKGGQGVVHDLEGALLVHLDPHRVEIDSSGGGRGAHRGGGAGGHAGAGVGMGEAGAEGDRARGPGGGGRRRRGGRAERKLREEEAPEKAKEKWGGKGGRAGFRMSSNPW